MYNMKKELRGKFKKLGISIVYLFGSRAKGRGSRLSDVDIGTVMKNPPREKDIKTLYHTLYQLFTELYPASKLDIVFAKSFYC